MWNNTASVGTYYVKGVYAGTTGVCPLNTDSQFVIGGKTCAGYIYGIALFNAAISDSLRNQTETALAALFYS